MKSSTEQLAQTVAALVQFLGAVVAFILSFVFLRLTNRKGS